MEKAKKSRPKPEREPPEHPSQVDPSVDIDDTIPILPPVPPLSLPSSSKAVHRESCARISNVKVSLVRAIKRNLRDTISTAHVGIQQLIKRVNATDAADVQRTGEKKKSPPEAEVTETAVGTLSNILSSMAVPNNVFFDNLTSLEIKCDGRAWRCPLPESSKLPFPKLRHLSWDVGKQDKLRRHIKIVAENLQTASFTTDDKREECGTVELLTCLLLTELNLTLNAVVSQQMPSHHYVRVHTLTLKQTTYEERDWSAIFQNLPDLSVLSLELITHGALRALASNWSTLTSLNISQMTLRGQVDGLPLDMQNLVHLSIVRSTIEKRFEMILLRLDDLVVNCAAMGDQPLMLTVPALRSFTHIVTKDPAPLDLRRTYFLDILTVKFVHCSTVPALYHETDFPSVREAHIYAYGANLNTVAILRSVPYLSTLFLATDTRNIRWNSVLPKVIAQCRHMEQLVIKQKQRNKMQYRILELLLNTENLKSFMITKMTIKGTPRTIAVPSWISNIKLVKVTFMPAKPLFVLPSGFVESYSDDHTSICIDRDSPTREVSVLFEHEPNSLIG